MSYFSLEMASLLKEYRSFCQGNWSSMKGRSLMPEDYIFRRHGADLPMTPSTFTWRFKLILKKHGLPLDLNVHRPAAHGGQPYDLRRGGRGHGVRNFRPCSGIHYRWIFTLMPLTKRSGRSAPRCRGGWGCESPATAARILM